MTQPNWKLIEDMSEMEEPYETLPAGVTVKEAVVELAKALMQAVNSEDEAAAEEEDEHEDEGAEDTEGEESEEMFEDEEKPKEDE